MDTNCVDISAKEADQAAEPVAEVIEGLEHRLEEQDLEPVTREQVTAAMEAYVRRRELIADVSSWSAGHRAAIVALLNDGHPELPTFEVNGDVLEDMDDRLVSDVAARAIFKLRPVTTSGSFEASGEQHSP